MSLRPADSSRRRASSISRSPRASPPDPANYAAYPRSPPKMSAMPGSFDNEFDDYRTGAPSSAYASRGGAQHARDERPAYARHVSAPQSRYEAHPSVPYPRDEGYGTENYWKDFPPHERPGYASSNRYAPMQHRDDDLAYGDAGPSNSTRHASYGGAYASRPPQNPYAPQPPTQPYPPRIPGPPRRPDEPTQPYHPQAAAPHRSASLSYADPHHPSHSTNDSYTYKYADEKVSYSSKHDDEHASRRYSELPPPPPSGSRHYSTAGGHVDSRIAEGMPSGLGRESISSRPVRPSHDTHHSSSDGHLSLAAAGGLATGMGLLSVGGGERHESGAGLPPPSPLLEAYRGTYQSISPMPLVMRPTDEDSDLSDLEPLSAVTTRSSTSAKPKDRLAMEMEKKKRVKLYDPEKDAGLMAEALRHSKPGTTAICEILPGLTHDEIMYLRKEYKKQVKIGGKGINLPKHMKTKLTGNFGKAAYVTALGRWESEGYWANFWYQSHSSRRELLIESLMGRTNGEIRNIDEEFRDKRYADSLVKCMEKELKMDKFRVAVLMVLQQRRQEEQDVYPQEYRERDVRTLHQALTMKQGGESAMLEIIVRRSDAHLREVLRMYEKDYHENFPRAALKKSNNLVGEVIAHILNGVINKPARDAILIRHAIEDIAAKNRDEELRYELLISRLVRLHWDRAHLLRVKREYVAKYGVHLEKDIEEATKGDFGEFMVELCRARSTAVTTI